MLSVPLAALFTVAMERQYTYDRNIKRIDDVFPAEPERPAKPVGEAQNWLLIGSDARPGEKGAHRADSIMLVHVPADRQKIFFVGIPRDSYVPISGHGSDKINSAYAYGGPKLLILTVEKLTGVRIDHFAALDFSGFVQMSKAIGGVDVEVSRETYDSANKITWSQGTVHLEGEKALLFVRQRYGLPGGDFDRIKRQQAFLRAVADKLINGGVVTDPFALNDFLGALTKSISVDSGVSIGTLRDLAIELRNIRGGSLVASTVPLAGTDTVKGASIVRLDDEAAKVMYAAIRDDKLEQYFDDHGGTSNTKQVN
ncbi:LCP family protein [Herbidospora sp. RD11066]